MTRHARTGYRRCGASPPQLSSGPLGGCTKPNDIMPLFKFTSDQTVKRLRWVMTGAILFCMVNTLSGQPESYWHHPETAIRGDGLSIGNETNHSFDFFLGRGWLPYLLACLIYLSAAFSFVSLLPRKAALTAIFSFLFGHFFEANNWLVVRWHLGLNATPMYGFVLATIIVFAIFPTMSSTAGRIVKRLRWVMLVPMFLDMINTLVGQPSSYWLHGETAHEANEVSRFFLIRGWYFFLKKKKKKKKKKKSLCLLGYNLFRGSILVCINSSKKVGADLYLHFYVRSFRWSVELVLLRMENGNRNSCHFWRHT